MRVTVDATPIRPGHAAGVEAFSYGLLTGLAADRSCALRVDVLGGTLAEWHRNVPDLAGGRVVWTETAQPLRSDNPVGQLLRRWTPRRVRDSHAVRATINAVRQRAVPGQGDVDVTLYPFHAAPTRPGTSVVVLHDLRRLRADSHAPGYAAVIRRNVARASAVVVTWPHPYQEAVRMFPEAADRIVLIPTPTFQPAPERASARPEPGLLLYPSSTAEHKNHATLLEAMALLPQHRLICPGPLVEPEASRLLARAARPDLRGRVAFPGFVSLDELNTLYARADAVVVPSLWEAASGAMLEAFSWGLPVACADVEPLLAQLEFTGAEATVFRATDPASLAAAVRRLAADRAHYAAASRRANGRLATRTWAAVGRDYLDVLRWAAQGRPGPVPRCAFGAALNGDDLSGDDLSGAALSPEQARG
ncbi:glycosyltransferase [Micromonospora sp. NBC_01813]|uniref:glycosyltransferase n=1 Tax=Micromonospora sp. NBC_01813 TaxID=2975988 RepID=UPI002DD8FC02|nr:glycosyltransferase [Micromonospora sp. NBC_01813]WSA06396.1 glycosyltransferase [Micromonospora sp. NBC_01813]